MQFAKAFCKAGHSHIIGMPEQILGISYSFCHDRQCRIAQVMVVVSQMLDGINAMNRAAGY